MDLMMMSIGLGLTVSLVFSELFAVNAGGLVSAGYLALYLNDPLRVIITLAASFLTLVIVRLLSRWIIIYGRRQIAAMILVGYLVVAGLHFVATLAGAGTAPGTAGENLLLPIGFVIPGLIAIWLERQGMIATVCSVLTCAVIVRLVLILIIGTPFDDAAGWQTVLATWTGAP